MWQMMPQEPPNYQEMRKRLEGISPDDQIFAAMHYIHICYMRALLEREKAMTRSNPELLMGTPVSDIQDMEGIDIPDGSAAILHSGYGVEGVFTNKDILRAKVVYLRAFNAYRGEKFSVSVHPINPESHP
jgi:hypothetical protein